MGAFESHHKEINRFRLARLEAGLSVRAAARVAGVDRKTIYRVEKTGPEGAHASTIAQLARAYQKRVAWLLCQEDGDGNAIKSMREAA